MDEELRRRISISKWYGVVIRTYPQLSSGDPSNQNGNVPKRSLFFVSDVFLEVTSGGCPRAGSLPPWSWSPGKCHWDNSMAHSQARWAHTPTIPMIAVTQRNLCIPISICGAEQMWPLFCSRTTQIWAIAYPARSTTQWPINGSTS